MNETVEHVPLIILLIGSIIVISIFVKSYLSRNGIPCMVGFFIIGFGLRLLNIPFNILTPTVQEIFEILAKIGVIVLLFRIGLESNISGLLSQLRNASWNWLSGLLISGLSGFIVCYTIFSLSLITSLIVGIALTATSVGISVGIWHEAGALKSRTGELLMDVAELDDISGIVLMALLFAVLPVLKTEAGNVGLFSLLLTSTGWLLLKLFLFGGVCLLFSLFLERHITHYVKKIRSTSFLMLITIGIGFIIASLAGMLGFSVAIGAFFAGLSFSRDPQSVKIDASFDSIYNLFGPFFFIGIGMSIQPASLSTGIVIGLVLVIVAALGKMIGHGVPGMLEAGKREGFVLGLSMVPRAEIAMIIMQHGLSKGAWAVPRHIFSAMVLVSALTCLFSPLGVQYLLNRWPDIKKE